MMTLPFMPRLWRVEDSFKTSFLNEVSSTLSKLRSGKKSIQANLINIEDMNTNTTESIHIDECNNSSNDIAPGKANMGQSQKELVDIDMPLGDTVPVTNSASVSDTPGANTLPLNSSVPFSSTSSSQRADILATTIKCPSF